MAFFIGNVKIDGQVVLAPMAGVTNLEYRKMAQKFGACLTTSEMISDKGIYYNDKKTLELLNCQGLKHPYAIQIFGGDIETLLYAAKFIDKNTNCDIIDINMGCPVPKIIRSNAGSKYLQDPERIYNTVKTIVKNVMASCQAADTIDSSADPLAALCGLSFDQAVDRLDCEDNLTISSEEDGLTEYKLPDPSPPWDVGEEGTAEISFAVDSEEDRVIAVSRTLTDMTHTVADETSAREVYELLKTEDERLTEYFGPTGFMAFTNGSFERLDDQESYFEIYPDVDAFISKWNELDEENLYMQGSEEWLSEGEDPVWLQFYWTSGPTGTVFSWNYLTEQFVAKQMGWEDLDFPED